MELVVCCGMCAGVVQGKMFMKKGEDDEPVVSAHDVRFVAQVPKTWCQV